MRPAARAIRPRPIGRSAAGCRRSEPLLKEAGLDRGERVSRLIGLDWGTTSCRAYLIGADGAVRERVADGPGILKVEAARSARRSTR
jgi:hypothetical protein